MITLFASLSIIAGTLMIVSKSRVRVPCFVGGVAAVVAGGFSLALPLLNAIQPVGWIWFCLWIAALPILVACVISLVVLSARDKRLLASTVFGAVAVLSNIAPTISFIEGAALGIVDALENSKANKSCVATADKLSRSLRSVSPAPPCHHI